MKHYSITLIIIATMLFILPVVHGATVTAKNSFWDYSPANSSDLALCGACNAHTFIEWDGVEKWATETISLAQSVIVDKYVLVKDLTGTDLFCFQCRDSNNAILNISDESYPSVDAIGGICINDSNLLTLPVDSVSGKRIFRFRFQLNFTGFSTASGGDEQYCTYFNNWENETDVDWGAIGAVDKVSLRTAMPSYYSNTQTANASVSATSPSIIESVNGIASVILNFVLLNYQLVVILFWVFIIGIALLAVGLLFAIPFFIYKLIKKAVSPGK